MASDLDRALREHAAMEAAFRDHTTAAWATCDLHAAAALCAMHVALLWKTGAGWSGAGLALLAMGLPALASLAAPRWYRAANHRCWVIAATRLGTTFLLLQTRDLAASGAFDAVPTPVQALGKVLGGCRVVPLLIMAHAYPLPVHWLAWVQLAAVAKSAVDSRLQLCQVPQLGSPVVKQLALGLAGVVERVTQGLGLVPADWQKRAETVDAVDCCFLLAFWLQVVVGYALPLLVRWLLTGRARKAFYTSKCQRRPCEICLASAGPGMFSHGAAIVGAYLLLAIVVWDVLFANLVASLHRPPR